MSRDDAPDVDVPEAPIGWVRTQNDTPLDIEEPSTSRDIPVKVILGLVALVIMIVALILILQSAMSVGGL